MTSKQFYTAWGAALTSPDRGVFVSYWALSPIWDDSADTDTGPALSFQLGNIWDVAHMTIRALRDFCGMTQTAFCVAFCVPRRTLENWEYRATCPDYIRLFIAEKIGVLAVPRPLRPERLCPLSPSTTPKEQDLHQKCTPLQTSSNADCAKPKRHLSGTTIQTLRDDAAR